MVEIYSGCRLMSLKPTNNSVFVKCSARIKSTKKSSSLYQCFTWKSSVPGFQRKGWNDPSCYLISLFDSAIFSRTGLLLDVIQEVSSLRQAQDKLSTRSSTRRGFSLEPVERLG